MERKDGYRVSLLQSMIERFRCPLCRKLMNDPIQTCRGEMACEYCYTVARSDYGKCPIDGSPIAHHEIFKDRCVAREIQELQCFCYNKELGCVWQGKIKELQDHEQCCNYQPSTCPICNEMTATRKLDDHLKLCSGLANRSHCIYEKMGCRSKISNTEDSLRHLKEYSIVHEALIVSSLKHALSENDSLRAALKQTNTKVKKIEAEMVVQMQPIHVQMKLLTNNVSEMQIKFEGMKVQNEVSKKNHATATNTKSSKAGILDLNLNDTTNVSSEIQNLSLMVGKVSSDFAELELRQQIFDNTTYDGRLLWKIDNFGTRYQQAVTGRVTALHSAPCFTGKYGYRFCARVYLNGDGMGKCTHMSVFFVVMKSEYDNLLEWPFNRRVSFKLVNQKDQNKNVIERFFPDSNSSSFKKPTKEMNVAAGCPMFLAKEDMLNGGYIKDDCLFMEVTVM